MPGTRAHKLMPWLVLDAQPGSRVHGPGGCAWSDLGKPLARPRLWCSGVVLLRGYCCGGLEQPGHDSFVLLATELPEGRSMQCL